MCQYSQLGPLGQFPNSGQFSGSSPVEGSDEVDDLGTSSSFFSQSSGISWCVCHKGTGRKPVVGDLALTEGDVADVTAAAAADIASVFDAADAIFVIVVPGDGGAVMPTKDSGATVACWGLVARRADEVVVEAAGVFGIELNSAADFRGASALS